MLGAYRRLWSGLSALPKRGPHLAVMKVTKERDGMYARTQEEADFFRELRELLTRYEVDVFRELRELLTKYEVDISATGFGTHEGSVQPLIKVFFNRCDTSYEIAAGGTDDSTNKVI